MQRLQVLLDVSIEAASPFLRSSFEMPEHSLSAAQLTTYLQGALTVALATVTARGEPRVAPIGALFLHGSFYVPTVAQSTRAHGHATIITADHAAFGELDAAQVEHGKQSVREWQGHGIYLHLDAARIYTYALHTPSD